LFIFWKQIATRSQKYLKFKKKEESNAQ